MIALTITAIAALVFVTSGKHTLRNEDYKKGEAVYLAGPQGLVHVHDAYGYMLVLSSTCTYLNDSLTTICRQRISIFELKKHKPFKINVSELSKCRFVSRKNSVNAWGVLDTNMPKGMFLNNNTGTFYVEGNKQLGYYDKFN